MMPDVRDVKVAEFKYWWRVTLGHASVLVWKQTPVQIECDQKKSVTFPPAEIENMVTCLRMASDIAARIEE